MNNRQVDIMGIVNLTGDSFFASSRHLSDDGTVDVGRVLATVGKMISEGATIVDFGACSSRLGAVPISAVEEWSRFEGVLKAVRENFPNLCVSIDTFRSEIVQRAYELIGKFIVNDISAGEDDPAMLSTVAKLDLEYVAMHKRGNSQSMQDMCEYEDVVCQVLQYFKDFSIRARKAGLRRWILDPGFGFAKNVEQNYELLAGLRLFSEPFDGESHRVLVGVSRKSMIYGPLGVGPEEVAAQTQVVHLACLQGGASILRVHDVLQTARTVSLWRKMQFCGKAIYD